MSNKDDTSEHAKLVREKTRKPQPMQRNVCKCGEVEMVEAGLLREEHTI